LDCIDPNAKIRFLSSIIDKANCAMCVFGPVDDDAGELIDFEWIICNRAGGRLLNVDYRGVLGKRLSETLPHVVEEGRLSRYIEVVHSRSRDQMQATYNDELGERFIQIDASPLGARGLIITIADITELKRVERQAAKNEAVLTGVVNAIPDFIFAKDLQGTYLAANNAMAKLVNRERETILGATDFDIFDKDLAEFFRKKDAESIAHGEPQQNDEWLEYPDGRRVLCDMLKTPIRDAGGNAIGIVGVGRDQTQRHWQELKLRKAVEAAEAASRSKSEFLANMSHEIRTPMTAILGFADLLNDDDLPPEMRSEYVETIRRNGRNLLTIVNDVLDLSKIEAGCMEVESTPLDPVELVEEIVSTLRVPAVEKGLYLSMELTTAVPKAIVSDPHRLRQVLINLVGNAIKFTTSGGVRIILCHTDAEQKTPRLAIEVADTGPGIGSAEQARIFEPFSQEDTSTTRRFGGTGLGLTISRRLVKLMNGELFLVSTPGQGSSFSVVIPGGDVAAEQTSYAVDGRSDTTTACVDKQSLSGHVLVVEDGPDNRKLIGLMLRRLGLEATFVEDGAAACETVEHCPSSIARFDLVLMDLQMPVMDGYQATRRLRDIGFDKPVIALTADAMQGTRERAMAAGCDDFLTKPIAFDKLSSGLSRYLLPGEARPAA
jgi:PAS domain S-box-containing protein